MTLEETVIKNIEERCLNSLETLSGWWLEHGFAVNPCESEQQYEARKAFVLPVIINAKLRIYEEEY